MNKEKMIIMGCMFAVNEMIGKGSSMFAHRRTDGMWETIDWNEILEYLYNKAEGMEDE